MSATAPIPASIDRDRVASLTEHMRTVYRERTARSGEYFERASGVMPGGVPSQFQKNDPWPVYIERGTGAQVWDVDGNEYLDFHNGFGVMCVGHANPAIAAAVKARMDEGTHFAAPTEGSITVAEELRRRWGLPQWRFTNSGTESTMDAIHLARGFTGRELIVKIEGTYHGHHDAVMVSVKPPPALMGDRSRPTSIPYGLGYPANTPDLTRVVPFNDADALSSLLEELRGQVAGVILEPAMMNINIVPPVDGYLERVRELTRDHGAVLIFDEVKTGAAVAAGGATELFGVTPDVVCLAKAICGGLPGGAVGMTDELGALVASGQVRQQGTFNGNPLVMAAAEATLLRGPHRRGLREAAQAQRGPDGRLRPDHLGVQAARPYGRHGLQGLRRVLERADPRVPRLPHEDPPRPDEPRVAVPHEQRHLHDAGRGRGVDAVRAAHGRGPRALSRGVRDVRARRDVGGLSARRRGRGRAHARPAR